MSEKQNKFLELSCLIVELQEGTIKQDRFNELQNKLKNDSLALAYYVEFIAMQTHLDQINSISNTLSQGPDEVNDPLTAELLREAIDQDEKIRTERVAEEARLQANTKRKSIEIASKEAFEKFKAEERRRQEKIAYKRYRARQRRFVFGITSLAALLAILVLGWIFNLQSQPSAVNAPKVVASITKSVNAKWSDPDVSTAVGTKLTDTDLKLTRGFIQITFDKGACANLRAPVNFRLENSNMMFLRSGNLFSSVPKKAKGFTIRTPGATVVDYGTDFGVTAFPDGKTEAHIFKGTVDLRTGSDLLVYNRSRKLTAGQASIIDDKGLLSEKVLQAQSQLFVREITDQTEESQGIPIWVKNHSFEDITLLPETHTARVGRLEVPNWSQNFGSTHMTSSVICREDGANGVPTDGSRVLTIARDGSTYQLLDQKIALGETYILTIDTKLSLEGPERNYSRVVQGKYSFFYVDNSGNHRKLASNNLKLKDRLEWNRDHTLVFAPKTAGASYLGNKLGIEFSNSGPATSWLHVDNIRVNVIPKE